MRFFEFQDAARGQTLRLVVLFALAVATTVLGVHLALAMCWWLVNLLSPVPLGFPRLFFAANVGVTLMLVLGGWWIETSNMKAAGGAQRLASRIGAREARPASSHAEQQLVNIVPPLTLPSAAPSPFRSA